VLGHVMRRETVRGLTVVTLAGDFDVATVAELRGYLAPCESATMADLAVDLREVAFIDCAVIGSLVSARNRAVSASACVRLSGLHGQPRRVLGLCALDDVFCLYRSVEDAAAVPCTEHRVATATVVVPSQRTPAPVTREDPVPGRSATGREAGPALRPPR
jgi:anti-anti-sigma factor